MTTQLSNTEAWPSLRVDDWVSTRDTLHMWTQIVGKVRLAHAPLLNHWWEVTLYVTPRGLTTSTIPYQAQAFDIEFDFLEHQLVIRVSNGASRQVALRAISVAQFYEDFLRALAELGIETHIQSHPNEVEPAIPFAEDDQHRSYDPGTANLFWRQLLQANRVLGEFRSRFIGKVSPVHFFWGAMDLACTRFSGRPAPKHRGGVPNCGDWVMVEAYSHELSSCGFWPGGGEEGAFYSYAYPEPDGYAAQSIAPDEASWAADMGEFLLPYEAVRAAPNPDRMVIDFLQSTYEAAATCGGWDRTALEVDPNRWSKHR